MNYEVNIVLPWMTGTLTMTPQHRGFLPTANGTYFRNRRERAPLHVCFVFRSDHVKPPENSRVNGVESTVTGRGYHDHPWGTQQIFDTNYEWNWARTVTPAAGDHVRRCHADCLSLRARSPFSIRDARDVRAHVTAALTVGAKMAKGLAFEIAIRTLDVPTPLSQAGVSTGSLLDTPIYDRCSVTGRSAGRPIGHRLG